MPDYTVNPAKTNFQSKEKKPKDDRFSDVFCRLTFVAQGLYAVIQLVWQYICSANDCAKVPQRNSIQWII